MTTISSNRRKKTFPLRTLLVTVVVALVLLGIGVWREGVSRTFWFAAGPVLQLRNALERSDAAQLRAQVALLEAQLADRDVLYAENKELKLRLGRNAGVRTILASVLLRPPGVPYDVLIVDAGAREGVAQGDMVSAGGTTLIGRVEEVHDRTSRVLLFSAPGESYQGLIAGKIAVSVEGQGGGSLRGQIPAGSAVAVGDSVLLPGIAGGFASQVSYIERTEGSSFETVFMHLPVNFFELSYVEIWKGQPNTHEE